METEQDIRDRVARYKSSIDAILAQQKLDGGVITHMDRVRFSTLSDYIFICNQILHESTLANDKCPECGEPVVGEVPEFFGSTTIIQHCVCDKCHRTWSYYYNLTKITDASDR